MAGKRLCAANAKKILSVSANLEKVYHFVRFVDRESRAIVLTQTNLVLIMTTLELSVVRIPAFRRFARVQPLIMNVVLKLIEILLFRLGELFILDPLFVLI